MDIVRELEEWIDQLNLQNVGERIPCSTLYEHFKGYHNREFLEKSFYISVDTIPKPDFEELRAIGLGSFLDERVEGITYKNTYYILNDKVNQFDLHFHELVHVVQWKLLGVNDFIKKYMEEAADYGNGPLEKMAFSMQDEFCEKSRVFPVETEVAYKLGLPT